MMNIYIFLGLVFIIEAILIGALAELLNWFDQWKP